MSKRWNWIIFLVLTLVIDVLGIFINDKFYHVISRTAIPVPLYYVYMGGLVASAIFCFVTTFFLLREKPEVQLVQPVPPLPDNLKNIPEPEVKVKSFVEELQDTSMYQERVHCEICHGLGYDCSGEGYECCHGLQDHSGDNYVN